MRRNNKKGFTIVELVIVIAAIAILTAVMIPTFSAISKKAQISADTQVVRNLNTALAAGSVAGKPATMYEALQFAEEYGYNVKKLNAKANGNEILWDSVNNAYCYFKGDKVSYEYVGIEKKAKVEDWQYWVISDTVSTKYSTYYIGDKTEFTGVNAISTGFDAGENTNITAIEYTHNGTAQDVVIRTNGGALTVNAANDHVEHYGVGLEVTVEKISATTYVEHGCVAKLTVKDEAKSVVLKETAVITELVNESATASITNAGYVVKVTDTTENPNKVEASTGAIKVVNFEQLQSLALANGLNGFDFSAKEISIEKDIDMTGKNWTPFGYSESKPFEGTILGNNHKITGMSSIVDTTLYISATGIKGNPAGLIAYAQGDVTIKDLRIDCDINAKDGNAVAGFIGIYENLKKAGTITFENCEVNGKIIGKNKIGGFIGSAYHTGTTAADDVVINFTNCTNNAEVTVTTGTRAGGFIGAYARKANGYALTFTGCQNTGKISGTKAGAIIGEIVSGDQKTLNPATITLTGATNTYEGLEKVGAIDPQNNIDGHKLTVVD